MTDDDNRYYSLSSTPGLEPITNELKKNNDQPFYSRKYLMMTLLAIPLGVPDGVTYSHFGFQAGESLTGYLSITNSSIVDFFRYVVGIGAPMGVYCFAVNNLMRELIYVVGPTENKALLSHPVLRITSRYTAFFFASLSMIPFAGMAMNAADGFSIIPYYLLVLSNSFARFCMNDYALRYLFEKLFTNYLIHFDSQEPVRNWFLQQLEKNCFLSFHSNNSDIPSDQNHYLDSYFKPRFSHDESNSDVKSVLPSQARKWIFALDACGYFVGALTATYLYNFAVEASREVTHVDSQFLNSFLAILGVVPTLALWADDSMVGIRVMVIALCNKIYSREDRNSLSSLYKEAINLNKLRNGVKTLGVLFATLGAYSESKMAYDVVSGDNGFYANLLRICTIPAFMGIYITSALQLSDKLINKFGIYFLDKGKSVKAKNIEEFDRASQLVEKLGKQEISILQAVYGGKSLEKVQRQDYGRRPVRENPCTKLLRFFSCHNKQVNNIPIISSSQAQSSS